MMVSVGIVVVTYNRASLLSQTLDALLGQDFSGEMVIYVVDNASTDETFKVVHDKQSQFIKYIYSKTNLGGAGGFHLGVKTVHKNQHDWIWIMDDDVVPASDCLSTLMRYSDNKVLVATRENKQGKLAEYSALEYNLSNPFYIQPKRLQVIDVYISRQDLPKLLKVDNFSFEGILLHKNVIEKVGYPFAEYFISGDDVDYAERIRQQGYVIKLVRDARIIRQLDFKQEDALNSWKGYYMYRNMFVIHFLYGRNFLVRLKPYFLMFGAFLTGQFKKNNNLSFQLIADAKKIRRVIKLKYLE